MIYLSNLLGQRVHDSRGETLGVLSDLIVTTGEAFPRVTGLVFRKGDSPALMVSWRKYVADFAKDGIHLSIAESDIRFSYLQNDEILLARDLLNKEVVDTQHKRVVKVADLKFSGSRNQLRLLGAEIGPRGALRAISPGLEGAAVKVLGLLGRSFDESILSWSYIDLLDNNLAGRSLSVAHKRIAELHPADLADVLEQLDGVQRVRIIEQLDDEAAAEAISELEDDVQLEVIGDLDEERAATLLAEMDPDDAADILRALPDEKSLALLTRMNPEDAQEVSGLLGYAERTAGAVMTSEVMFTPENTTVAEAVELVREVSEDYESVHYVYLTDEGGRLTGVLSLRSLLTAEPDTILSELAFRDLITASPDDDQREVADAISKYGLLAMPIIDENGILLGIVTVDDAMAVLEEEKAEEFEMATGTSTTGRVRGVGAIAERLWWFVRRNVWVAFWAAGCLILATTVSKETAKLVFPSLVLLPIVLIICDDVISWIKSEILSQSEAYDRPSILSVVVREFFVSAGLSLVLLLAVVALFSLFFRAAGRTETFSAVMLLALPTVLTIPATLLIGVGVGETMRRRYERVGTISGTGYSLLLMLLGTGIQAALALLISSNLSYPIL